jgi:hypothetical protein
VFFPVNQYYFSRFESVFTSDNIIFLGGRECFPRQPVLLFYVGESVFYPSASIIFLGWSVFPCQPVLFFLVGECFSPQQVLLF